MLEGWSLAPQWSVSVLQQESGTRPLLCSNQTLDRHSEKENAPQQPNCGKIGCFKTIILLHTHCNYIIAHSLQLVCVAPFSPASAGNTSCDNNILSCYALPMLLATRLDNSMLYISQSVYHTSLLHKRSSVELEN